MESISPFLVYKRVVFGAVLVTAGLFWPVQNNDRTLEYGLLIVGAFLVVWGWNSVRNPRLALKYANSPSKTVAELIEEWSPTNARLESEYERSLHEFLKSRLTFVKVTRQYGTARVKCDIATGSHVIIELKTDFKSPQKLQRLIGQVDLYHREWEGKPIIVVIVGDCDDDLLHDLHRSLEQYTSTKVIVKGVKNAETKVKAHSA